MPVSATIKNAYLAQRCVLACLAVFALLRQFAEGSFGRFYILHAPSVALWTADFRPATVSA